MHKPINRRVVCVRNERHCHIVWNVDVGVLVNAGRMVGHVDDDVRRIAEIGQAAEIQRAIAAIAAAVNLGQGDKRPAQGRADDHFPEATCIHES